LLDPFDQILLATGVMIYWAALVTGFLGSAHCVGMCGGLVTAVAPDRWSNLTYQLGRMFSYSALGLIGGFIGHRFTLQFENPWIAVLPSLTLGVVFLWMGIRPWMKLSTNNPIKKRLSDLGHKIIGRLFKWNFRPSQRSFLVGLFSFLLPCGFLYGAIFISITFQNPFISMMIMWFFWLGTTPAMSFAPEILRRVLSPFQQRSPVMTSLIFVSFGLITIGFRVFNYIQSGGASCH
jgi:uncharacterized protein